MRNTNLISKVSVGNYFGGNIDGFKVETTVVYPDGVPHFLTKVWDRNGDIAMMETHTTIKSHKVMARAMLADIAAYVA
jgi:hypothetical protein